MKSAMVRSALIAPGMIETAYQGIITADVLPLVQARARAAMAMGRAAVVRSDKAVMVLDRLPPIASAYQDLNVPAALVVHPDHYEFAQEWAELLAREVGLVRVVFLAQNLHLARRWAEDRALATLSVSPPLPPSRLVPGPWRPSAGQTTLRLTTPRA
jgi:hypothetical protein